MKFTSAITFCLASQGVWASPAPKVQAVPQNELAVRADNFALEARADSTVVGTIDAVLNDLVPVLGKYESAISSALSTISGATSAQLLVVLEAVVNVNANIGAIVGALNNATAAITTATASAAGGVLGEVEDLTASDVAMLENDIQTLENIINGLNATIILSEGATGAAKLLIAAELAILKAAIAPLVDPVLIFANAAVKVGLSVSVTGLQNALTDVESIVSSLYNSLGVPNLMATITSALATIGL